jgi:hypothetical protein
MKSLFTTLIAISLFVLCLLEKEAKQQAILAQRLKEKSAVNQKIDSKPASQLIYAKAQKKSMLPFQFQLAEFAIADSTMNATSASSSL